MPSSFQGSDQAVDDSINGSTQPFHNNDYVADDPSPGFVSLSNLDDSIKDPADEVSPIFTSHFIPDTPSVPPIYGSGDEFGSDPVNFSEERYEDTVESGYAAMDGAILPPPEDMYPEEGYALREWRRENSIRLEEKEKIEKESLTQIIDEAEEYKIEFYKKREIACAANKSLNRDKEQSFLSSLKTFHEEANKSYWKSIADLIPNEVPKIEKRGKKEQEKKPSVVVVQGPKPGKPADLSRMRQLLVKLKHNTPTHLNHSPPSPVTTNDAKPETAVTAAA